MLYRTILKQPGRFKLSTSATLRILIGSITAALAVPSPAADNAELQTVTVTATRREESLQKVPVAVSVVSGESLEQAHRDNVNTISSQVPSVTFRTQQSNKDTSLLIRGVGTISTSPGVEPSVSTVIDGVVLGRPGQATLDLLDIERVEVLRGPQGTLFGKNASAGVFNIVTRAPSEEFKGFIDASYFGSGGEKQVRGSLSGALIPGLLRASVLLNYAEYDGNVKNVYNGETVNGYRHAGFRSKFELTPSDDLRITFGIDQSSGKDTTPSVVTSTSTKTYPTNAVNNFAAFADALAPVQASGDNRKINNDFKTYVEDVNRGVSAQVDWTVEGFTLTSITAYRTWDNLQFQDGDRLAAVSAAFPRSEDRGDLAFQQFSQELRIASPKGNFLDYVAGLYYLHTRDDEVYQRWVTSLVSGTSKFDSGRAVYGTKNDSYSAFGEATLNFTDSFRGILGARWTQDSLEYHHRRASTASDTNSVPGVRPAFAGAGSSDETGYSGRAGLQYDLTPDITGYFTYSRGYKGPAYNVYFNMQGIDTPVLDPETSNSFELGLKSTLFDNRLVLNTAVFDAKYKNFQANSFDTVNGSVVTRLINAGDVSTKGIEVDFTVKPLPQLTVSGALARIDARIDNFNCPVNAAASCDVNGRPLPYSPDWKANAGATYDIPLAGGLNLVLGADYNWQSETQYDIAQSPSAIQGAYGIWNASIALSDRANGWRAALLAKNIGDKSYASFLGAGGTYVNRVVPRDDQRYFGVDLRKDF